MSFASLSIKLKVTLMLAVLALVSIASGVYLFWALSVAANDATIIEVMGRQRMLSQAMAKSVLGTASAKDIYANVEERVEFIDTYITKMRGNYTKLVISTAKKAGIGITSDPANESHPAVPFPATFLRIVNTANSKVATNFTVDILSQFPINTDQGFKTAMDKKAGAYLLKNKKGRYYESEKTKAGMFLNFYTPDTAVVKGCATCHTTMENRPYKLGDLLGIRKYKIRLSSNAELGEIMLKPSLAEYETANKIFTETLAAMRSGGSYPTDLALKNYASLPAVPDSVSQKILEEIEAEFTNLKKIVDQVLSAENVEIRFKGVTDMLGASNQLRGVSNNLVARWSALFKWSSVNVSA